MLNRKRNILIGASAALLVAGGVAGIAGVVVADQTTAEPGTASTDVVDGFGEVTDDFSDHEREAGILCDGCDNSSDTDLVTLWQMIVASDGTFDVEAIDGDFGPETAKATAEWQKGHELEPTGEVDRATWAAADDSLSRDEEDAGIVTYVGFDEAGDSPTIEFDRVDGEDGAYMLNRFNAYGETMVPTGGDGYVRLFEESFTLKEGR